MTAIRRCLIACCLAAAGLCAHAKTLGGATFAFELPPGFSAVASGNSCTLYQNLASDCILTYCASPSATAHAQTPEQIMRSPSGPYAKTRKKSDLVWDEDKQRGSWGGIGEDIEGRGRKRTFVHWIRIDAGFTVQEIDLSYPQRAGNAASRVIAAIESSLRLKPASAERAAWYRPVPLGLAGGARPDASALFKAFLQAAPTPASAKALAAYPKRTGQVDLAVDNRNGYAHARTLEEKAQLKAFDLGKGKVVIAQHAFYKEGAAGRYLMFYSWSEGEASMTPMAKPPFAREEDLNSFMYAFAQSEMELPQHGYTVSFRGHGKWAFHNGAFMKIQ
ncbi:MAG: hypothetical protein HUK26_04760 [Duodenibacillus sp.]|nr:hypothetical protein [Duodenibacillus sp.]